jgi:hypothetical protein
MKKSLNIGHKAEQEVVTFFEELGFSSEFNKSEKLSDYDIKIEKDGHTFLLEVKDDRMSKRTGNVAIEFYNSKSCIESGISATKADLWVHKIKGEFYIISVSKLKDYVLNTEPKKIVFGGGDDNSDMYLYSIGDFLDETVKLDDLRSVDCIRKLL